LFFFWRGAVDVASLVFLTEVKENKNKNPAFRSKPMSPRTERFRTGSPIDQFLVFGGAPKIPWRPSPSNRAHGYIFQMGYHPIHDFTQTPSNKRKKNPKTKNTFGPKGIFLGLL
jgi:hypothetical protein